MTNAEKIKKMSNDDLAFILMCPYDTAGDPEDIMPCVSNDNPPSVKHCCECIREWLLKEAKEN